MSLSLSRCARILQSATYRGGRSLYPEGQATAAPQQQHEAHAWMQSNSQTHDSRLTTHVLRESRKGQPIKIPPIPVNPAASPAFSRHLPSPAQEEAMRRALHTTRSASLHRRSHSLKRPLHVYTQGEGFLGALGHGDFSPCAEARPVEALASTDVRCVSAGWTHSAAVSNDGGLLVWGRPFDLKQPLRIGRLQRTVPIVVRAINAFASDREVLPSPVSVSLGAPQPKLGSVFHDARPMPPPAGDHLRREGEIASNPTAASAAAAAVAPSTSNAAAQPLRAKSVACSGALTVVLDEEGRVYCMGYNRWGQCGQGPGNIYAIFEPLRVGGPALEDERVTSLAVGFQQVLVLCESGRVYGWGKGLRGQLGIGCETIELPTHVALPGKVVELRSGFSHAVAVLENGDVYVWGRMQGTDIKKDGSVPVFHDQLFPRKVDIPGGGRVVEAFCSSFNTLLRLDDGRVMMFGLEADTRRTIHKPSEVDIPMSPPGSFFSGFNDIILKTEGVSSATSCSLPEFHRLCFTSNGASVAPFALPGLDGDRRVEAISVGWQHTIALVR